jgi:ABC-type antimicrobial peptide transport system permease subunit
VDGYEPGPEEEVRARWAWAGARYFETVGIPVLSGRTFTAFDTTHTPPVVVINEMMARRYFGTPDAVGRRFRAAETGALAAASEAVELEVVGVVPTVRMTVLDSIEPMFYRSFEQSPAAPSTVVVRTAGDPEGVLPSMQRVVRELDARLPVTVVSTMPRYVSDSLGLPRTAAGLLAGLGALGLLLAAVGLYAVVAFAVSRRALEIGIRLALGAQRNQVIWAMSRDVAALLAIGLLAGLTLSWLAVRGLGVLAGNLSEAPNLDIASPAADALTFLSVATLMVSIGLAATVFPARRAARTESLSTLRHL